MGRHSKDFGNRELPAGEAPGARERHQRHDEFTYGGTEHRRKDETEGRGGVRENGVVDDAEGNVVGEHVNRT